MELRIFDVRLAFPKLFKPEAVNGEGDPRFGAAFLFAPGTKTESDVRAAIIKVANEAWGAKAADILKDLDAKDKLCLHSGDAPDKAKYDGFQGNLFVSAGSDATKRPLVIDTNRGVLTESDGKPYAGCYVNALIDIWAQDNKYGKRVNARLMGVQFLRDGDSFGGGRVASMDDFDVVAVSPAANDPWGGKASANSDLT